MPTNSAKKKRRDWRPTFLAHFATTGNVMLSAKAAGIDRNLPYMERRKNTRFADAWEQAEEDSIQLLEAEARRRAMATSDTLMIFLLKARRPKVYRENRRLEVTGGDGGPLLVDPLDGMTDEDRRILRQAIDEALAEEQRRAREAAGRAEGDVSGQRAHDRRRK